MDYKTYQERVLARASHRWHAESLDVVDLELVMTEFIAAGNKLDRVKKALMYGRLFVMDEEEEPLEVETKTPVVNDKTQRIIHAALGIATEGVELIEQCYKHLFDDLPLDEVNLQEEFGDAEWYRALGLDALGQTHEENLVQNDNKLEKRFGKTFTEEAANNRDLDAERKTLEEPTCYETGLPLSDCDCN